MENSENSDIFSYLQSSVNLLGTPPLPLTATNKQTATTRATKQEKNKTKFKKRHLKRGCNMPICPVSEFSILALILKSTTRKTWKNFFQDY